MMIRRIIKLAWNAVIYLRENGLYDTFFRIYLKIVDILFDVVHNVDTFSEMALSDLTIESENREKGRRYEPSQVMPLRKLFRTINPFLPKERVLVDIGCGKGRVLLVASEFGFRSARGVEFARELCDIARANYERYKRKRRVLTEFEVIEGDASKYVVRPDENIIFMFNPFQDDILRKVLANISASIRARPRNVLIIFKNPKYDPHAGLWDGFIKIKEYNYWGYHYTLYSNVSEWIIPT